MSWHSGIPEEYRNQIVIGDSRELMRQVPDQSVDLIFTDPVYQHIEDYLWLATEAARVLKPNSACLMWQGQQWLAKTIIALAASPLSYRWVFGWYASNNMQMVGKVGRNLAPLLWYETGHSNPHRACREVVDVPIPPAQSSPFKWAKQPAAVAHYLDRFTKPGDVILDPFSGGGSLPVVCRSFGREYIAFEIDPETATMARERVRNTILPLLVVDDEPRQIALGID